MDAVKSRLLEFVKHTGLSRNAFEAKTGLSQGYLKNFKGGISPQKLDGIRNIFPDLSIDWLLTGEGSMLKEPEATAKPVLGGIQIKRVPVVPHSARAGYILGWDDPDYNLDELETLPVIIDREYHGDYMIFEVSGDSMDDNTAEALIDGDYILCRKIDWTLWRDSKLHIRRWSNFVVEIASGEIVVKNITEHDVAKHTITLHSRNPDYADRLLDLAEVRNIYNVVQLVQRRMR